VEGIHVEELRLSAAVGLEVIGEGASAIANTNDGGFAGVIVAVRRVECDPGNDLKPDAVLIVARDAGGMSDAGEPIVADVDGPALPAAGGLNFVYGEVQNVRFENSDRGVGFVSDDDPFADC